MSRRRCRADSFYIDPKTKLTFASTSVHAVHGDIHADITHRNDFARFAAAHPDWDGTCLLTERRRDRERPDYDTAIRSSSARYVRIDERSANGRRPEHIGVDVHTIGCGQRDRDHIRTLLRARIDDPQRIPPILDAVSSAASNADAAHRYRFLVEASTYLDRSDTTRLARYIQTRNCGLAPVAMSQNNLVIAGLARFEAHHRLSVARTLWDSHQIYMSWAAIDAAIQHDVRIGRRGIYTQRINELAVEHEDMWISSFAAFLSEGDQHDTMGYFDFSPQFLDKLAAENRSGLAAAAFQRNGRPEHLAALLDVHGWERLIDSHITHAEFGAERCAMLAETLRDAQRRNPSELEAERYFELAAVIAEEDSAYCDVYVDAAVAWLGHRRRTSQHTGYYTAERVANRSIDLDAESAATLRAALIAGDGSAKVDNIFATQIASSSHITEKFRRRLHNDFTIAETRPRRDELDKEWESAVASGDRHRIVDAGEALGMRYATQRAVVDERIDFHTYRDLVNTGTAGIGNYRNGTYELWNLVRDDELDDRHVENLTSPNGAYDNLDVMALRSTYGHTINDADAAKLVAAARWGTDAEHYAAAALSGVGNPLGAPSFCDNTVDKASQITAAAHVNSIWPDEVTDSRELPRVGDTNWDLDPTVTGAVNGVTIDGGDAGPLNVEVIPNVIALRHNGAQMRNCTGDYGNRVAAGDVVVCALRDSSTKTTVNVSIARDHNSGTWSIEEINGWANSGVPEDLRNRITAQLGHALTTRT